MASCKSKARCSAGNCAQLPTVTPKIRITGIGLPGEDYGTHSLRRTKASIIYKATGKLRAAQILLVHTKIESTVRYLGVDVEDALTLAEGTEI